MIAFRRKSRTPAESSSIQNGGLGHLADIADQRHRAFFIGAGFSKAAGYPLGGELWNMVRDRARYLRDRAEKLHSDLQRYVRFRRECDGQDIADDKVDFEDFMRFLDIEHFLGLRGSDTWSRDGNEGTIVVKTLIGEILAELTPAKENIPPAYLDFADGLQPSDCVFTFNYDTLLEAALDEVGKPYRLFAARYESIHEGGAIIDSSRQEITVLKLHGSIDWFDRSGYAYREKCHRDAGSTSTPEDPVFAHTSELGVSRLLDGPRLDDDPLGDMYRVRSVKALYEKGILFSATPWLLSPSAAKILYADKLRDFWHGMGSLGYGNFGLAIIGYSLPPQDEYAKQILYSVVTNYQQTNWDEDSFGRRKTPVILVDRCVDDEALARLKSRYRFMDWSRTQLHTEGFNADAVRAMHLAV